MYRKRTPSLQTRAEVEEFVSRTGVDSLAIAIGTSHGAYKFKPGQKAPACALISWKKCQPPPAGLPDRAARRFLRAAGVW